MKEVDLVLQKVDISVCSKIGYPEPVVQLSDDLKTAASDGSGGPEDGDIARRSHVCLEREPRQQFKVRKTSLSSKNSPVNAISVHAGLFCAGKIGLLLSCILLLFFASFSQTALSQVTDRETTFRLAQGLEQAGEYDRALVLLRQLYNAEPTNLVYFDELQRTLMQLKRYDEVILLIRGRLRDSPGDVSLRAMLGSVYYRSGNERAAEAAWDSAIAVEPANPNAYRIVASTLGENRLLEQSAEVYRRGRARLGDSSLFAMELSQILSASMDYAGATNEYLRWLDKNPTQLAFVQGRMASFTAKKEARDAAAGVIRVALDQREDLTRLNLLVWLELEGKDFGSALDIERRIDRLSQAHGTVLQKFGDRAFNERAFGTAIRAYEEAIESPLPADHLPFARYGRACAMEGLGALSDTSVSPLSTSSPQEAMPLFRGAVEEFRKIIEEYPNSVFAAKSLYQIGRLQFEKFTDLDGAVRSFQNVLDGLRSYPRGPDVSALEFDVDLMLGRIQIARGDTAKASERFTAVAASPGATQDQSDEALFHLAEIDFFADRFKEAEHRLDALTVNLKADYANNALQLRGFLAENSRTAPEALRQYARAEFLARQHKNSEAIAMLRSLVESYPQAPLVDDALMSVAALQEKSGLWPEAALTYERLLTQYKESSIALDHAQFRLAEVYQYGLKNIPKAIATYEQLLVDHPSSVLVESARRRIRQLRGDTL
jgi:tetratricopeptide (TPR) repeat protein